MILVTGPTGFVGRQVVGELTLRGHAIRGLVHTPSRAAVLSAYGVEIVEGDVLDPESLARACEGVDAVIHLVTIIRERGDLTFQHVNYDGTRNILAAASAAGAKRFVLSSAIGASSDPSYRYLYSQWMAEQEVSRGTIPYTIVRFSVGFGEGDEFFNVLAAQVKLSPIVPVAGNGKARFQPIAVEDVARCLVEACERDETAGMTLEAGGPEYFTYDEMLDLVSETLGARIAKVHVPVPLIKPVIAAMEALSPRPPATLEQLKMLDLDNATDLDSVESAFGFAPRSIKGNLDYISRIGLRDALKINLGFMPTHIRDH